MLLWLIVVSEWMMVKDSMPADASLASVGDEILGRRRSRGEEGRQS
jgi:hypothetical protein